MRLVAALALSIACCAQAHAADLSVRVVDAAGAPVTDAVVSFAPATPAPVKIDGPYKVSQRNIAFDPFILIVPVGAEVRFPNLDRVRHHVYSFSAGNRFELDLYGRDETRTHVFKTAGVAAIGCNIHDQMQAYIVIVDTPYAARTDADGTAALPGASGAGELRVWSPTLRARGGVFSKKLTVASAGAQRETVTVELRPSDPPMHH